MLILNQAGSLSDKQRGATMIEVMVALFLLAIGLLGVLSLQNTSQRSNQSAMYSSVAVLLARDMANRLSVYDDPFVDTDDKDFDNTDTDSINGASSCSSNCNKGAVLNMDKGAWAQAVKTRLPGGRGTINVTNEGVHQVVVMWDDLLTGADETGCGGDPATDLTCVTLEFRL